MEEDNIAQDIPPEPKQTPIPLEKIKKRCRICGHRFAIRKTKITNIRDAVFVCEYCGK